MTEKEIELTATNEMQSVLIKHLLRVAKYDDFIAGFNEEGCDLIRKAKPDPKRAAALGTAFHHLGFEIPPSYDPSQDIRPSPPGRRSSP